VSAFPRHRLSNLNPVIPPEPLDVPLSTHSDPAMRGRRVMGPFAAGTKLTLGSKTSLGRDEGPYGVFCRKEQNFKLRQ